jgi:hypothetical protein
MACARVLVKKSSVSGCQFRLGVERTHAAAQYIISAGNLLRMARLMTDPPEAARA